MSDNDLPTAWVHAPIHALISQGGVFIDGDWIESKDQDPNGEVRLIQLADVGDGVFHNKSARFLTKTKATKLRCTFLKKGDLLIARMPDPLGRACVFPLEGEERFVTVVDVCIIRTSADVASPEFLKFAVNFLGTRNQIGDLQTGSTRKRISRSNLASVTIPVPPLAEQRRIVAKIEELFSELDAGEESLRRARRQLGVYRQSLLKQAFEGKLTEQWRKQNPAKLESLKSLLAEDEREKPQIEAIPPSWEPRYMKNFVSIERGRFSVRPRGDPRYYGGDTPFVQIGDLPREGGTITGYKQTLNKAGLGVSKLFRKGTPLIAIVGATIGNTGILGFDSCCPDSVVALVSPEPITGKFVELYFRAHKDRIRADSYSSGGQPNINNAYLERQLIGVPSLPEQQEDRPPPRRAVHGD